MLGELTRSHCLTWINTSLVERGSGDRTRNVKANRLNQFLTFHRVIDAYGSPLLEPPDIPNYCEAEVLEFTAEEMAQFWAVCRPTKKLRCKCS